MLAVLGSVRAFNPHLLYLDSASNPLFLPPPPLPLLQLHESRCGFFRVQARIPNHPAHTRANGCADASPLAGPLDAAHVSSISSANCGSFSGSNDAAVADAEPRPFARPNATTYTSSDSGAHATAFTVSYVDAKPQADARTFASAITRSDAASHSCADLATITGALSASNTSANLAAYASSLAATGSCSHSLAHERADSRSLAYPL